MFMESVAECSWKTQRRTLSRRASRFQEDQGRAILPSCGGGWAAYLGNIGLSLIDGLGIRLALASQSALASERLAARSVIDNAVGRLSRS